MKPPKLYKEQLPPAKDIFSAIRYGDSAAFGKLVSKSTISQINEYAQNALHECAAWDQAAAGKHLITMGINLNQQDHKGMTPLHYAAVHSNIVLAQGIIASGGDISVADCHGNQPLWTAALNARGKYEIVALLMAAGADAHHSNNHDRSPLDFAKQTNDAALIQILSTGQPRTVSAKASS